MLPVGHDKALKYAFYNVIAMIVSVAVILAFWGVYCILEPFIKALMWAILCGSVLHPFKEQLCSVARTWLKGAKTSSAPFTIKIMTSPLVVADSLSEKIGNYIWKSWKPILGAITAFFVTYIVYYNPPVTLAAVLQYLISGIFGMTIWILSWINGAVVVALNVGYLVAVAHFVISSRKKKNVQTEGASNEDAVDKSLNENDSSAFTPRRTISEKTSRVLIEEQNKGNHLKLLSYVSWSATAAYICLKLSYTFLIPLGIFAATGANVYLRSQREKSFRYTLPTISRMACMMVLNIGAEDPGKRSRPRSTSQILPPGFVGRVKETPSFESTGVPSERHRRTSNDNSVEKLHLFRSFSEGHRSKAEDISSPQDWSEHRPSAEMPSPILTSTPSNSGDEVDGHGLDSNTFLYGVFCACVVVSVWNRLWLMHLVPIPLVYYGIKKLSSRVGAEKYIKNKIFKPLLDQYHELDNETNVLVPEPVKVLFRIFQAGDRKLISICEAYVDPVASLLVVVLVVMSTVLGLIFAATQVYAEGDHLVRVTRNLINTTVSQHPEINEMLPEGWQSIMNSMVGNAFHYGREYISNMIRDSVAETDPAKAAHIEKQVVELWDKIYLTWNQTWENAFTNVTKRSHDSTLSEENQGIEWVELFETGKEMPNILELSVLTNYARANVGTLWSILDSLRNILVANISLVISALTSIMSLLFGGGTAILNLIINLVVFFTALFYLLSASTSVYKPVELFNQFSPGTGVHTNRFAIAVEEAVSGVFHASFKMAAFYGMWTWLIHTLFQVNIVFVPAIFAGLFAAVPLLMPYWAAFPAVLELWLIQDHWPKALCMLLAQMAPMSAVDTQIYSEISGGGHPYLTGLAVAGGIFCFGFQGAIMGPVILCLVVVVFKVGNSFLSEGTDSELLTDGHHFNRNRKKVFGDNLDATVQGTASSQKNESTLSSL
ncbi:unnamed protein product [Allacma fusca]|uniref:Transmembrane protein 245 n=1 Tax=Allacma fusca TaxID=39272 RepID=A0A8J2LI42_9HEXA|nr:unnamed protein product [Allacma fusca]